MKMNLQAKLAGVSEQVLLEAILRQDLAAFIVKVFQTLFPDDEYLHNWHIDAVVNSLMQVYVGKDRRLIITQPPRSLKSLCTSVAFVAWWLGHDPSMRFACISYSHIPALDFARQFRTIVTSDWYRALFPNVQICKDTETECVTSKGGGRFVVPVGGSFTGRGADVIIIDDPIKAEEAQSEKLRRSVNEWYATTLLSRLDDKKKGAIILVMQRLHEDDLAGMLLREGGWSHLNLPAIAEEDQQIPIGPGVMHWRKEGEVLHPERESLAEYEELKREMGSIAFSAQYQQQPIPIGGNLVRRKDLKWYNTPPDRVRGQVVQSWDLASTVANTGDWSVCTTWLMIGRTYYLLDLWRGRLEYPDLKDKLLDLAHGYRPGYLLIEKAGPGQHIIQELIRNLPPGVPFPTGIRPEGDKVMRMEAQCACFQAGQVYLPEQATWLATLLHELLAFPRSQHDDQIDSVSQFLKFAETDYRRGFDGPPGLPIVR